MVAILSSVNDTRLHMYRNQYITKMYKYTFETCYVILCVHFFRHLKICEIKSYCPTTGYYFILEHSLCIKYYSHHPLIYDVIIKHHYYNHLCTNANHFVTKHIILSQHNNNITKLRCSPFVPSGTLAPLTGTLGTWVTGKSLVTTVHMREAAGNPRLAKHKHK